VDRYEHGAQLVVGEHHAHRHAAGELGQQFGVARVRMAGAVQRLLRDGRGDDRADFAAHGHRGGALDAEIGRLAGPRVDPAGGQVGGEVDRVDHRDAFGVEGRAGGRFGHP